MGPVRGSGSPGSTGGPVVGFGGTRAAPGEGAAGGTGCRGSATRGSPAQEVMQLVLFQLVLSLRWEPLHSAVLTGTPDTPLEGVGDRATTLLDTSRCPLLWFLLRYSLITRNWVFLSEIYWTLCCLAQDPKDKSGCGVYEKARRVLVATLQDRCWFCDGERRGVAKRSIAEALGGEPPPPNQTGSRGPPGPRDDRSAPLTAGSAAEEPEKKAPPDAGLAAGAAGDDGGKRVLHITRSSSSPSQPGREPLEFFLRRMRRQLWRQRQLWREKMELYQNVSGVRTGSGAWAERSQALRHALRQWRTLRQEARGNDGQQIQQGDGLEAEEEEEEELWGPPDDLGDADLRSVDLVSPAGSFVCLPIDPEEEFRGLEIANCEVIPSKTAPLLLSCKTIPGVAADAAGGPTPTAAVVVPPGGPHAPLPRAMVPMGSEGALRERLLLPREYPAEASGGPTGAPVPGPQYMLKTGDDLRQDQLMLQMMSLFECVWRERLPASESRMLRLAPYKVLAVTPQAGYVKFVPRAESLSRVLRQSHGDLLGWLDERRDPHVGFGEVLENFCGSVAAYSVATYVLGIGDRHLDNLMLTPTATSSTSIMVLCSVTTRSR